MDWNRMTEDVVEAARMGEPVVYGEDDVETRTYLDELDDSRSAIY